ncbi:MAG: hypothetical protein A3E83_09335 [Gammaproteobacteria bacterium RIFCSPHIGHO2_12_FULL_41_20]|nr:MAG: hypothetical protein A3E83_09335 [Gammaproteobacteria bacterium RIFCSPHIGHO2_12_FULL_41_20]
MFYPQALRLSGTRFNNLLLGVLTKKHRERDINIEEAQLLQLPNYLHGANTIEYIKITQENVPPIYIFKVSKDSQTKTNESQLAYIGDVIQQARTHITDPCYTLLLPMRQCRGFGKLPLLLGNWVQRQHIVLVQADVNTATAITRIQIHDSQSWSYTYPDKLNEIASSLSLHYSPAEDYHAYGRQRDHVLCGYYVLAYIAKILAGESCQDVALLLNQPFFDETVQLAPDATNITSIIKQRIERDLHIQSLPLGVQLDWPSEIRILPEVPSPLMSHHR